MDSGCISEKTKILSNIPPDERPESLKVGATSIEVLKEGVAERYLGRKLTLDHYHATELANRISPGWAAFTKHKVALCDQRCHLRLRLKLFESTVTPVALSHLLFSTGHHAGRCGRTQRDSCEPTGEEC